MKKTNIKYGIYFDSNFKNYTVVSYQSLSDLKKRPDITGFANPESAKTYAINHMAKYSNI